MFSLGQSAAETVNITLPYLAFDLQATQPIAVNGTNYFPLRCSTNATQYVLGRAFLQETYLFVDYETSSFSLSQTQFSNNSDVITISYSVSDSASGAALVGSTENGLSNGAVAGIAIGASIAGVLLLSFLFFLIRRSRRWRQGSIKDRAIISAPIPIEKNTESWPNSPTSSGNTGPAITGSSNSEPFQRLEERLERLERANTGRLPEYTHVRVDEYGFLNEFPGESAPSREPATIAEHGYQRPE